MKRSKVRNQLLAINVENDACGNVKGGFSKAFISASSLFRKSKDKGANKTQCNEVNNCKAGNCYPGCWMDK